MSKRKRKGKERNRERIGDRESDPIGNEREREREREDKISREVYEKINKYKKSTWKYKQNQTRKTKSN